MEPRRSTAAVTPRAPMAARGAAGGLVDRGEHIRRGIAGFSRGLADHAHLVTSRQGLFAGDAAS